MDSSSLFHLLMIACMNVGATKCVKRVLLTLPLQEAGYGEGHATEENGQEETY